MRTSHSWFGLLCWATLLASWTYACTPERLTEGGASARFGVLFGGQIQQRSEIPFELDPLKQSLALEIIFKQPLNQDSVVHWELSKPGTRRGPYQLATPEDRITEFGDELVSKGQRRLEKRFTIKPGDNLGLWNIRVNVDSHVLLDRPFSVFDPTTRRTKPGLGTDAGL
jgi:hypothetical protein